MKLQVWLISFGLSLVVQADSMTVQALIERALERSEQLLSQKARVAEKQELVWQAGAFQNPNLNLSAGAKSVPSSWGSMFQFNASQLFFVPGKQGLREKISRFDQEIEALDLKKLELMVALDVTRLAYEYAIFQRKVQFAQGRRKRFELIQTYLASHTFASPNQIASRLIVGERLRNLNAEILHLSGELLSRLEQLRFYVPMEESSPDIQLAWFRGVQALEEGTWIKASLGSNLSLVQQQLLLQKSSRENQLFKLEVWPDFSLSAFYTQERAGGVEQLFGLGLGFHLPLWNRNQGFVRASEQKVKSETYLVSVKAEQIRTQVRRLLAEYNAQRVIVQRYPEKLIGQLESRLEEISQSFRKGRLDFILFLELDVQSSETAFRALDAQLSFWEHLSSLYALAQRENFSQQMADY